MPQRVDSDRSATITTLDVLGCSNSRTISGLKLVSDDCGQSMDSKRSPACHSRKPDEVEAGPVKAAGVLADRELAHPLQDEQLDLGDVGQADERLDIRGRSSSGHAADRVLTESAPAARRRR